MQVNKFFVKVQMILKAFFIRELSFECDKITYTFTKLSNRRLWNWLLTELSAAMKLSLSWGYPTHMMIEPTNICNLRCSVCPVGNGAMTRPSGMMSLENYKKIIDEMGECLLLLLLFDWGEPFLNENLCEMIQYAKGKGIKVVTSTNGHFIYDEGRAKKVIDSGLDVLIFAVDGSHQETYEKFRVGGNLEIVLKSLKLILKTKRQMGAPSPLINLRFIPMRHNEHEITEIKEMAKEMGVDLLSFKTLNPYDYEIDKKFESTKAEYRRFQLDSKTNKRIEKKKNRCKNLWNMPVIHWDGFIVPCCYDYNGNFSFGNLFENHGLKVVWNNSNYRIFRKQFSRDPKEIPICRKCAYNYRDAEEFVSHVFRFD